MMLTLFLFVVGAFILMILQKMKRPTPIETLKNALLSYALMKCGKIDDSPIGNYASFDGSILPAFARYSTANACFSYIQSDYDRIFGPFATKVMDDKHKAIVKYLERNLNTEEQVLGFFENFTKEGKIDYDLDFIFQCVYGYGHVSGNQSAPSLHSS
jgi:hypothetical protein